MSYNPYAAPSAESDHGGALAIVRGEPQPWDVRGALSSAWEVYKRHWAPLTAGYFVLSLVAAAPPQLATVLVLTGVLPSESKTTWLVRGTLGAIGWVLSQLFTAGFVHATLRALRADAASFGDFFSAGRRYVPYVLMELLKSLAIALGTLLLVVPGVILALGFANAPFFVMDQGLGPSTALRASWESTRGQKGGLLVLALAQTALTLLGLAACCLGVFVAVPVTMVAQAIVYMKMTGTLPPMVDR